MEKKETGMESATNAMTDIHDTGWMINHTHTEKDITKSVLRESCSKADETKWMKK